jgi:hypothetical protein
VYEPLSKSLLLPVPPGIKFNDFYFLLNIKIFKVISWTTINGMKKVKEGQKEEEKKEEEE